MRRRWIFVAGIVLFAAMQFVPYGHRRASSNVGMEPNWDSARTRELFFRACGDCHSNETRWPWYSQVAPVSWFTLWHVKEGRQQFNMSAWTSSMADDAHEAGHQIRNGKMPLRSYLLGHPEARLTAGEKDELIRGLQATVVASSSDILTD